MADFRIGDLVVYKTNQFIAFNKPPTIPVQPDKSGDKALINLAEIYCKSKLYLIHRLDRPASGIILFAKNKNALAHLNEQFTNRQVQKTYLAVVRNPPETEEGTLIHYLKKNGKLNRSFASLKKEAEAKKAELSYKIVDKSDYYHLLEIQLITGRHHQIRAQLAAIQCPVKGDVKYGARRKNSDRSIHLHAWKLEFSHPITGEKQQLIASAPDDPVWNAFEYLHPTIE
ncbi:MAG: RNA pseudouridine synthase [Bacteroidetes bacterium]|nr:RNA pseudouridine synthase [Bacteroidota bacterium]